MAKLRMNHTVSKENAEYLKQFPNASKVLDEALELHRIKDKLVQKPIKAEVIKVLD